MRSPITLLGLTVLGLMLSRGIDVAAALDSDSAVATAILLTVVPALAVAVPLWLLRVSDLPITDNGIRHLKQLAQLRFLNLSNTKITDAGLQHLGSLTNLTTLHLTGTAVSDEAVAALQAALPNLQIKR